MPSTVEKLSPTRAKLTVEIPFSELQPSLDKAYRQIAEQVTIPGFRKGRVPSAIIDQRVGRETVLQDAVNAYLPQAYGQAVYEHDLHPMGTPEVEVTRVVDPDFVEFVAEMDIRPEFTLPDAATIKVSVDDAEVTDAQVDERVEFLRQRFATPSPVDRAAGAGDVVTIDLVGTRDGAPLQDATASGLTYKIGSGGMLEGLDEAVTGLSAGESATFSSTLVGGTLAGEPADITVTVTAVAEENLPEVNDEFAQLVSQFDTVDEMRADLREGLERMARNDQLNQARDKVLEAILAKTEIELPEKVTADEIAARRDQISTQLAQAGVTLERYLAEAEDEPANTPDEFWADIEARALDALRAQMILDQFAELNPPDITQDDLSEMVMRKARANGTSPEQEAQHMIDHNHMPEWVGEVRRSKALNALVAQAKVTDASGRVVDLTPRDSSESSVAPDSSESSGEPTSPEAV